MNSKTISRITQVHKTPNDKSDTWYVDVEFTDKSTERKKPITNKVFMGLVLRLRLEDSSLVCPIPELKDGLLNFGR